MKNNLNIRFVKVTMICIFFILALSRKGAKKTLERGNRRSARTVYLNTKAPGTPKLHIPHALHGDFFNHEWIGILITDTPITDNPIILADKKGGTRLDRGRNGFAVIKKS